MRPFVIFGAYLAACLVCGATFTIYWAARIGFHPAMLPEFALTSLVFGAVAAPIAVPIVFLTEMKKRGSWWIFTASGLLIAASFIAWRFLDLELSVGALILIAAPLSTMTYWLIAWHRFPPRAAVTPR
ncbi:hypothetical protein [uncultured Erythrobacter sp.]|uniref:hypothetical protein n=1 Tax=uncultured Erythrobacter sp. TaxID=263913 RepID=UPI002601AC7C|nr:hypothetical protein [uncultured Erythrobacter sp.]